jgi:Holliday junction resolvase RusA-like endonuclease
VKYAFSVPALPASVNKLYKPSVSRYGTPYMRKQSVMGLFVEEVWAATKRPREPLIGEFKISVHFSFADHKKYLMSDVDNLLKNCFDALVECQILKDDRYIFHVTAAKSFGEEDRTEGVIESLA